MSRAVNWTYYCLAAPNGLKDVANHLGFKWSQPAMSGLLSTMWRVEWESTVDPKLKDQLLAYNADDCEAAQRVADTLNQICQNRGANIVQVDSLKREYPQRFGATEFAVPAFEEINSAAYWGLPEEQSLCSIQCAFKGRNDRDPQPSCKVFTDKQSNRY